MTRVCVGYASLNHVTHVRQPILVLCSCQTHRPIKHVPAILLCNLTAKQVQSVTTSSRICSNIDGLLMCAFQKEATFLPFLWRQCHKKVAYSAYIHILLYLPFISWTRACCFKILRLWLCIKCAAPSGNATPDLKPSQAMIEKLYSHKISILTKSLQ